jgi:hypothetical protein
MTDNAPEFTHYGWFGCCPVKIGDLDSDAPVLAPRWMVLEWLFDIQEVVQGLAIGLCSMLNPEYEPQWKIRVSGEIPLRS